MSAASVAGSVWRCGGFGISGFSEEVFISGSITSGWRGRRTTAQSATIRSEICIVQLDMQWFIRLGKENHRNVKIDRWKMPQQSAHSFLLPLPSHLHSPDLIDLRAAEQKKT